MQVAPPDCRSGSIDTNTSAATTNGTPSSAGTATRSPPPYPGYGKILPDGSVRLPLPPAMAPTAPTSSAGAPSGRSSGLGTPHSYPYQHHSFQSQSATTNATGPTAGGASMPLNPRVYSGSNPPHASASSAAAAPSALAVALNGSTGGGGGGGGASSSVACAALALSDGTVSDPNTTMMLSPISGCASPQPAGVETHKDASGHTTDPSNNNVASGTEENSLGLALSSGALGGGWQGNNLPSDHPHHQPSSTVRLKLCRNFLSGTACPFGDRCVFAHGDDASRVLTARATVRGTPPGAGGPHSSGNGGPGGLPLPPPSPSGGDFSGDSTGGGGDHPHHHHPLPQFHPGQGGGSRAPFSTMLLQQQQHHRTQSNGGFNHHSGVHSPHASHLPHMTGGVVGFLGGSQMSDRPMSPPRHESPIHGLPFAPRGYGYGWQTTLSSGGGVAGGFMPPPPPPPSYSDFQNTAGNNALGALGAGAPSSSNGPYSSSPTRSGGHASQPYATPPDSAGGPHNNHATTGNDGSGEGNTNKLDDDSEPPQLAAGKIALTATTNTSAAGGTLPPQLQPSLHVAGQKIFPPPGSSTVQALQTVNFVVESEGASSLSVTPKALSPAAVVIGGNGGAGMAPFPAALVVASTSVEPSDASADDPLSAAAPPTHTAVAAAATARSNANTPVSVGSAPPPPPPPPPPMFTPFARSNSGLGVSGEFGLGNGNMTSFNNGAPAPHSPTATATGAHNTASTPTGAAMGAGAPLAPPPPYAFRPAGPASAPHHHHHHNHHGFHQQPPQHQHQQQQNPLHYHQVGHSQGSFFPPPPMPTLGTTNNGSLNGSADFFNNYPPLLQQQPASPMYHHHHHSFHNHNHQSGAGGIVGGHEDVGSPLYPALFGAGGVGVGSSAPASGAVTAPMSPTAYRHDPYGPIGRVASPISPMRRVSSNS